MGLRRGLGDGFEGREWLLGSSDPTECCSKGEIEVALHKSNDFFLFGKATD